MKLSPNINQRGRMVRLLGGILVDACAAWLIIAGVSGDRTGMLIGGIVVAVIGSFMIFEGANGWCLLRALGMKTRL